MSLLTLTPQRPLLRAGDFFVDPWEPVDRAVITHAHGDHAAWGSRAYLTSAQGAGVLRARLEPGAPIRGARVRRDRRPQRRHASRSTRPATSSARPRCGIEHRGEVWVVSGDYKTDPDPTCAPFEPVRCHTFVTESTFGLPIYRWPSQAEVFAEINAWWRANAAPGKASLLLGYALGKAQRLLAGLDPTIGPILTHGAVERMTERLPRGRRRAAADPTTPARREARPTATGAIVIAPPYADASPWSRRFGDALHRLCLRLDGGPRRAPAALARPRVSPSPTTSTGPACWRPSRRPEPGEVWVTHGYTRSGGALAAGARPRCQAVADPVRRRDGEEAEAETERRTRQRRLPRCAAAR